MSKSPAQKFRDLSPEEKSADPGFRQAAGLRPIRAPAPSAPGQEKTFRQKTPEEREADPAYRAALGKR